jgi:threonine/homoserine/homoserine lactone efflux protein
MKWAGGTYLVWMGFQIWRSPAIQLQPLESVAFITHFSLFRQGLLAAISNPKVLLFFSAFLPQFINLEQPIFPQFLVMAATFAVAEFLVEYLISRVASKLRPWLERSGKHFNRGCGGVFALIGIALPLAQ